MSERQTDLTELIEDIRSAAGDAGGDGNAISIADIQEHLGRRSFGPLLLFTALPLLTPLVAIPFIPSIMGVAILLVSVQMLIGRSSVWLPEALRKRSVDCQSVNKAADFTRPVSRVIDRWIRPRMMSLTRPPLIKAAAACCALLGLSMPALEFVPGTSMMPAVPVFAFGLGITTGDGLIVALGYLTLVVVIIAIVGIWALVM